MGYGRLGSSERYASSTSVDPATSSPPPRNSKLKFLLIFAATLIVACGVSVAVLVALRNKATGDNIDLPAHRKPSKAMSRVCSKTRYPTLCVDSLLDFPGSTTASNIDLVHISVNMTLRHFGRALSASAEINNLQIGDLY
ncbi:hypothetical protein POM88_027143 [Heracleum sosnowskyi]|uniref:Pectinesterase inhibitor domain-containing protein n=1 Tax=Heracleum sosnowskyi TaxID=360622 RepID=A0AAD8I8F1_9APIA|nr:hypothetical protein POM88_027143 [Heracleum sosnowskyi]